MPKVSTIDRHALAKVIRPALDKKLKELSEELGVQLTTGSGQYGYTTGFLKIEIATITEDGQVLTPERDAFLKYHGVYDLPKDGERRVPHCRDQYQSPEKQCGSGEN